MRTWSFYNDQIPLSNQFRICIAHYISSGLTLRLASMLSNHNKWPNPASLVTSPSVDSSRLGSNKTLITTAPDGTHHLIRDAITELHIPG